MPMRSWHSWTTSAAGSYERSWVGSAERPVGAVRELLGGSLRHHRPHEAERHQPEEVHVVGGAGAGMGSQFGTIQVDGTRAYFHAAELLAAGIKAVRA